MKEFGVNELVPHSGSMSLLSKIVDYGEDWLYAEVQINNDSMFVDERGVPAWIGLEYMAQAVAAHAGSQERKDGQAPKLGFLLGTRKYICSADYFSLGQVLSIKVQRVIQGENGLSAFQCFLHGENIEATASLNVFQPNDASEFLKEASS
ncbi:MAG: hotdog family protein [Motiliproteus sp.]